MLMEISGSVRTDSMGDFVIDFNSATMFVRVIELSDGTPVVRVASILLCDVPLTAEVYRWVATEGQNYFFGHVQVQESADGTGSLVFEHHLLGEYLDLDELGFAVFGMGPHADRLDDELKARFGGIRFDEI